jgi:hypothetical protein
MLKIIFVKENLKQKKFNTIFFKKNNQLFLFDKQCILMSLI